MSSIRRQYEYCKPIVAKWLGKYGFGCKPEIVLACMQAVTEIVAQIRKKEAKDGE